nr:hypothetical protein CFP56_74042 [Quercus suber]
MITRFSKLKLVEVQEKKAKGGTVNGLLFKKKTGDVSKKDFVTSIPYAHLPAKRPTSPTSSLEMIASGGEEIKKKKKASGQQALFVDDLNPLTANLSSEVMFSHIQKLVQVENDKERVVTLEKSLQVEKDFCKIKDKQIGDLELKLENVGATAIQDFKDSNEYSDELCKYYVEGFDLLVKWMAKHYPGLDLSGLAVDDIEKELLFAEVTAEEAIDVAEEMKKATVMTPADPVPDK